MYKCSKCGYVSAVKLGKCPNCGEFGTFQKIEELNPKGNKKKAEVLLYNKNDEKSISWNIKNVELKRVFETGIKKGGVYLLAGEPGIGKSTLILQIINELVEEYPELKIGYFSGEEQVSQIVERRERVVNKKLPDNVKIFFSTSLDDSLVTIKTEKFDFVVFDSIQTIYSALNDGVPGSVSQIKYCAEKISEFSKKYKVTSFIIGHVTKGGEIAGPKYLEHIVDVVLYLQGDRFGQFRFLRSKKNRFASADQTAIFEMTLFGLQPAISLKDKIFEFAGGKPGSVFSIGLDNGRPVFTVVEVLLSKTYGKYPTLNCIGVSQKRVEMIVAILEKYLNLKLGNFNIFVNVPGEFQFFDSGLDLAIASAIWGHYKGIDLGKVVMLGEITLAGKVLKTKLHSKRLKEVPAEFDIIDYQKIKNIVEIQTLF